MASFFLLNNLALQHKAESLHFQQQTSPLLTFFELDLFGPPSLSYNSFTAYVGHISSSFLSPVPEVQSLSQLMRILKLKSPKYQPGPSHMFIETMWSYFFLINKIIINISCTIIKLHTQICSYKCAWSIYWRINEGSRVGQYWGLQGCCSRL